MNDFFDWSPFDEGRWSPSKPGDEIKGIVVALRQDRSKDKPCPVVTIREHGRDVEVWATATLLKQELVDASPQIGDGLHIRLTELRQTGQPSPLKVFSVVHKTAEEIAADREAKAAAQ